MRFILFSSLFSFFLTALVAGNDTSGCCGRADRLQPLQEPLFPSGHWYEHPSWPAWVEAHPKWVRWVLYKRGVGWCERKVLQHHPSCSANDAGGFCDGECWHEQYRMLCAGSPPLPPSEHDTIEAFKQSLRGCR